MRRNYSGEADSLWPRRVAAQGEDCVDAALKLAQRQAELPTKALIETRKLLRAAASNELDTRLDLEARHAVVAGRRHDSIEGVMVFREKRPAPFPAGRIERSLGNARRVLDQRKLLRATDPQRCSMLSTSRST